MNKKLAIVMLLCFWIAGTLAVAKDAQSKTTSEVTYQLTPAKEYKTDRACRSILLIWSAAAIVTGNQCSAWSEKYEEEESDAIIGKVGKTLTVMGGVSIAILALSW